MFPGAGGKRTLEQHRNPTAEEPFSADPFNFGLATDVLHRSRTQSDNHILVNDDFAASSRCGPTLKLLNGKLLSITWGLFALKRWQKAIFLRPSVRGGFSRLLEPRPGAVVTVWPLTFRCPEEEPRPSSSSRQILYSYEIFLVLSAIYFTYTVQKLPSDAQFFFSPPWKGLFCPRREIQQQKANETSS